MGIWNKTCGGWGKKWKDEEEEEEACIDDWRVGSKSSGSVVQGSLLSTSVQSCVFSFLVGTFQHSYFDLTIHNKSLLHQLG